MQFRLKQVLQTTLFLLFVVFFNAPLSAQTAKTSLTPEQVKAQQDALTFFNGIQDAMEIGSRTGLFNYNSTGSAALDVITSALEAQTGFKMGGNFARDSAICNSADFAGTAGRNMAGLEAAYKAFMLPSMITQLACPKKATDESTNILTIFTDKATGETSTGMLLINQIIGALGGLKILYDTLSSGGISGQAMTGYAMGALGTLLGGGDVCAAMSGIWNQIAKDNFFFNPGIAGLLNGMGGSYGGFGGYSGGGYGDPGKGVGSCDSATGTAISIKQAYALAQQIIANSALSGKNLSNVDPIMMVTMMGIESAYNTQSFRQESVKSGQSASDRASCGLSQVLGATANEIFNRGYTQLGSVSQCTHDSSELYQPEVATYYNAAYIDILMHSPSINPSSEEDIVRGYNGGPGWKSSSAEAQAMTANHWRKYLDQKALVEQCLAGGVS